MKFYQKLTWENLKIEDWVVFVEIWRSYSQLFPQLEVEGDLYLEIQKLFHTKMLQFGGVVSVG